MADLILFHHVLGRTPGVEGFAGRLEAAGHSVTVPDLYDGVILDTIAEGSAHAEALGFEALLAKAGETVGELPEAVTYAGFSLGALAAHKLAQTRAGAVAALLYHYGDVPMSMFGEAWPAGVPLQMHISEGDAFREAGVPEAFIEAAATTGQAELFNYPGGEHLFTDSSLPGYDADATDLVLRRSLDLLERVAQ